jgi:hypothetical protein
LKFSVQAKVVIHPTLESVLHAPTLRAQRHFPKFEKAMLFCDSALVVPYKSCYISATFPGRITGNFLITDVTHRPEGLDEKQA